MDAAQLIQIYALCFYIFLGIAILGFALAVFFFFFFDIPSVFALMTGRAQKKAVERLEKHSVKKAVDPQPALAEPTEEIRSC